MKRQTKIILGICILSWIATCISYFYLPKQIPLHFDMNFEPDGYGKKEWIFLIGAAPFLCQCLGKILQRLDPNKLELKKHTYAYDIVMSILSVLFLGVNWIIIYFAWTETTGRIEKFNVFPILFGVCFILIGNYLPIIKHNYFLGIKTPWTLAGKMSWKKTHRLGGYLFVLCGFLLSFGGILGSKLIYMTAFFSLLGVVLFLTLYSYLIYCKYDLPKIK